MGSPKRTSTYNGTSQQTTALLRLREMLLSGEFTPGKRLPEIPLANRLGVSRTPLRLALSALEHEGLLEESPTRGYIVRSFQRTDIFDSIEIRGLLEGMAGRLAVERGLSTGVRLEAMKTCVAAIDVALKNINQASDEAFRVYIEQNRLFHEALLALAASSTLSREMDRVTSLPFAAPSSGFVHRQVDLERSRDILRIGQAQHHAILEALEQREGARVEMLLREHARLVRMNLEIALEDRALRTLVPGLRLIREADRDPVVATASDTH